MSVFEFDIAGSDGLGQRDIVVRHVRFVPAFIDQQLPVFAIERAVELILMEHAPRLAQKLSVLVGVIDLDGAYGAEAAQIGLDKLAGPGRGGAPVGLDAFIDGIIR